jgi:hypothetical protein
LSSLEGTYNQPNIGVIANPPLVLTPATLGQPLSAVMLFPSTP